jgi:hypothetical protein
VHFADDRAMIELAVRRASTAHQLIGNGTRFGWSDLGPAIFYVLAPGYRLLGHRAFAIPLALLILYAVAAAWMVALVGRRLGVGGGYLAALALLSYLSAFGFSHFTNVWAPWEIILPLLLTVVLAAIGAAERQSLWALLSAAAIGSVVIQTKIEMVVIVPVLLLGGFTLRVLYHGVPLLGRDHQPWRERRSLALIALVVVLWLPPLWQQVTGHPGNLGEVARFTMRGASGDGPPGLQHGHALGEGLAALGEEFAIFPFGHHGAVAPGFENRVAAIPGWAVAVGLGYLAFTAGLALAARRRHDRLAAAVASIALVSMLASLAWTMHIQGPISFFLIVWASVLPLATWLAFGLLVRRSSHPRVAALRRVDVAVLAAAVLVASAVMLHHAGTFDYNRDRSDQILALDTLIAARQPLDGTRVRVHISTAPSWAVATGVVLDLVKRGADVSVDPTWVPYFGSRFDGRRLLRPELELWFDQPGQSVVGPTAGASRLGATKDIELSARAANAP